MKKIFALMLSLCLLCGTVALANEYGPGVSNTPTTILKVDVGESYTVVIPASLDIPVNQLSTNLPIDVTALRLLPTGKSANTVRKLYVKVSNNDGTLDNENGDTINYSIGGSEASGIKKELYFTETGKKNFTIDITEDAWNAAPAGSYTNTITFTIAIVDFSN